MITTVTVGILAITTLALFGFGINLIYLTWLATRLHPQTHRAVARGGEPRVCVQVPIYNERYVAERVLDAVCELDWPRDRFEIQVLDDSDDETVSIVARRAAHWRRRGITVMHVRRNSREGFKAGALAYGMTLTDSPFIAIFDADFVPPNDFLRRTMQVFEDPTIGFAQARWGHLDEGYSWFTRLQALAIDFHFLVEQAVRSSRGYFTNFTGTAGVWRRSAIEDSGGWSAATLTEDLDLSYRAQLRGWRAAYLEDLVVPEELPVSIDAFRRQQSRWATGSFQSAFRLLVPVLRSRNRATVKLQATVHLLAYGVGPLMLAQLACYPMLLLSVGRHGLPWQLADASVLVIIVAASPWIGFMVAQTRRGRPWWSGFPSLLCQVVGAGMSFTAMLALARATRRGGEFVRTPKYQIVKRGQEWRDQAYVRVGDPRALGEAALGLSAGLIVPFAIALGQVMVAIYASLFAVGFLTLATLSAVDFLEVMTLRSLGRRALGRVRMAAPALGLLALCGLLLLAATQMAEPFEDGYGHWLIAANLASTGQLRDPLFGMQDTWLPGYHVLAAAVLRVFGLWQMGALKVLGALLGLATLACVYAIAPSGRQGRLAVGLLVLNPVFLFTSSSMVVEPLLTALFTGGALAAVRGRMRVAALLALLACFTATKAWIWIGAVVVFVVVESGLKRFPLTFKKSDLGNQPSWKAPLAWRPMAIALAVPAITLLVFLQFGFAPATHSVARGSIEVASATARGSLPVSAMGRLLELTGTFGLVALPLFALGLVGLVLAIRQPAPSLGRATLRFLYVPALVYLAAVFGLVTIGAFTGSHRYLYPALPALALLAAAALDRHAVAVRLATVAAGGLLAVAFLPVFSSFASDNAGLIAAGKAAAGSPGMLVTDSPVVAFYSGKSPSDITGSQVLPAGRQQAIAWMGMHRVSDVILEGISYYRATSLFPDLASGNATPPFKPLGEQAQYQVAGGKPVFAYRLGAELQTQSIYPGVAACIEGAPGTGKTAPLAKGVVLEVAGLDASGEGMGFGVPIVHYADGWVYSRTATTIDTSTSTVTSWQRVYHLDEIGGDAAHGYSFVPIASRGVVEVTYTIDATGISVGVRVVALAPGYTEVGILNEQSAVFNDLATDNRPTLLNGQIGNWVPVTGSWARLQSNPLGVQFSLPTLPNAQLHGGRELIPPDFNWAGLDYIFNGPFRGASYHINVQEAR
ncbi:MAG TPA: glycosyltransferase [Candidatus Dormibacteraeota bacterium]|nr:glycosyltransferase [Candidatus Dormibacteraeota bacterium]